ncbi:MspA family porin [Nocardia sp. NPDC019395]|uniref:MspA family porin n=1 Tax=Nocardia sp. NPDC019395 TaxID=3154686 RepID=UPI0033D9C81E
MIGKRKRLSLLLTAAAAMVLAHFPAPPAAADVVAPAPHERSVTAADGRILRVGNRPERVDRVASGMLSRRSASVDIEAYGALAGRGKSPLESAELAIGYHVGCAVALAEISAGVKSLLSAIGLSEEGPYQRDSTIVVKPDESKPESESESRIYPGMTVAPEVTMSLATGSIADIRLATAPVRKGRAAAGIRRTHITVEGCIGPAAIRSYAVLTTKSALADETVVVYGDPVLL